MSQDPGRPLDPARRLLGSGDGSYARGIFGGDGQQQLRLDRVCGVVRDSQLGTVHYLRLPPPALGLSITGPGLPPAQLEIDGGHTRLIVAGIPVVLRAETRGRRRFTGIVYAGLGPDGYSLRPRRNHRSVFYRDVTELAILRERMSGRQVNWTGAAIAPEQALAHLLVAAIGI